MAQKSGQSIADGPQSPLSQHRELELMGCLSAFRRDHLQQLLVCHELPKSGAKRELLERISEALSDEKITEKDLLTFFGGIEPWDKQQVYLFSGPEGKLESWRNEKSFRQKLKPHDCSSLLDSPLPLLLPAILTLSSIEHQGTTLQISATLRRDSIERRPDKDTVAHEEEETILYQAYHRTSSRGIVRFRWNFVSNTASLQISQLPRNGNYDQVLHAFSELLAPWLDLDLFSPIDLSRAISRFHVQEDTPNAETRSQEIDYSVEGRRLSGRAATASDPLLGVAVVDHALNSFRDKGVGYSGNFYFHSTASPRNPIASDQEVHVHILAEKDRVRFFTANTEENFSYVLQRIRAASQG